MKNMKKLIVVGVVVLVLTVGVVSAFAAAKYSTPAEAVAGLAGRELQSVIDERAQSGKTYGAIAKDAGVLDEFKAEMLEMKKDTLAKRVAAGEITEEQAEAIMDKIISHRETCDGSGAGCGLHGVGLGMGTGLGRGCGHHGHEKGSPGNGQGCHVQRHDGQGNRHGMGACLRDGSCAD